MAGPGDIAGAGAIFLAMILPLAASSERSAATPCPHHPGHGLPGQGIDAGAAAHKIVDHLRRHLTGKLADPFINHPMIPGHNNDNLPLNQRLEAAGDAGQINGQVHQPAQCPVRHGELVEPLTGALTKILILGLDPVNGCLKQTHGYFS
jgi:hypothetical protein